MNNLQHLNALYGLKWNPFLSEVPSEALTKDDSTKRFCWRAEQVVLDGGFALVTGEPGTGKSVTLRHLKDHLKNIPELTVRIITRPQSGLREEVIKQAGSAELMTPGLIQSLAEHAMGNLRAMMLMANELLANASEKEQRQLDENLFFEVYRNATKKKRS